jgi:hypothetical protein
LGDWRDAWATLWYVKDLSPEGDRYRVNARIERGRVLRFTVQLEVVFEGRIFPAIRYDTAHGGPHRDTVNWTGRVVRKEPLPITSLNRAMTEAIEDVKTNWKSYREEFERRKP